MRFYCNDCEYGTNKKSSYDDHLLSIKHNRNSEKNKVSEYICKVCDKQFKSRSGLWKHNKLCVQHTNINITKEILSTIIKNAIKDVMQK